MNDDATVTLTTVGIVGGGTMGQGIAIACAAAGLDVLIADRTPDLAARCVSEVSEALDRDIAKCRRTASEKKAVLARIKTVDSVAALPPPDLEAVGGPRSQGELFAAGPHLPRDVSPPTPPPSPSPRSPPTRSAPTA
jgi:hypothetical protein